jgi:hypothetical protein
MVFAVNVGVLKIIKKYYAELYAMCRMRDIDFRECSIILYLRNPVSDFNYSPELSIVELIPRCTVRRYVYEYEMRMYTERVQYADAPPNPPVMPSNTHGTVRMSTEGVATGVEYELKEYAMGFNVNRKVMSVRYERFTEMMRLANWDVAERPKPNPTSVVV